MTRDLWFGLWTGILDSVLCWSWHFFQALDRNPIRAAELAEYRLLWLDLSHLATQTGAASCYKCGCFLVHHFFMVALSVYATLADVFGGNFYSNCLPQIFTILSASMVIAICEGAHTVFLKVSNSISLLFILRSRVLRCLGPGIAQSV